MRYLIFVHKMMTADEADCVLRSSFVIEENDMEKFTGADLLSMFPDISDMPVTNLRPMTAKEIEAYRMENDDD